MYAPADNANIKASPSTSVGAVQIEHNSGLSPRYFKTQGLSRLLKRASPRSTFTRYNIPYTILYIHHVLYTILGSFWLCVFFRGPSLEDPRTGRLRFPGREGAAGAQREGRASQFLIWPRPSSSKSLASSQISQHPQIRNVC